jgi:hypothetical protein
MIVRNPPDFPAPARDALLQHTAAKIDINLAPRGAVDCVPRGRIRYAGFPNESCKALGLEYPRIPLPAALPGRR